LGICLYGWIASLVSSRIAPVKKAKTEALERVVAMLFVDRDRIRYGEMPSIASVYMLNV